MMNFEKLAKCKWMEGELNGSFFANFCKIKMSPRGMIEEEWVDIKIGNMQFAKKMLLKFSIFAKVEVNEKSEFIFEGEKYCSRKIESLKIM